MSDSEQAEHEAKKRERVSRMMRSFSPNPWHRAFQMALVILAAFLVFKIASFYERPSEAQKLEWRCRDLRQNLESKPIGQLSINDLRALRGCRDAGL